MDNGNTSEPFHGHFHGTLCDMMSPLAPSSSELYCWLRLSLEPSLSAAQARTLLTQFGLPPEIYSQSVGMLSKVLPSHLAAQLKANASIEVDAQIQHAVAWAAEPPNHLITLADPDYPQALLESHDPPLLLYAKGNKQLLNVPSLAIVGARSSTQVGNENAFAFAQHLSEVGWSIVSGLATGIDAAAHAGSLAAQNPNASTIAVLGTGLDIIYPARNRDLAHQIAQAGLLLSEFPLGTRALPHHFPQRNRLVAGLATGVLVVEAALKSGSLITARQALELGREVFAIPGSIHSPLSRGCHQLIRQGAKLVESAEHIQEELSHKQPQLQHYAKPAQPTATRRTPPLAAGQQQVLDVMGFDPITPEAIQHRTQLDLATLATHLLELELAGKIALSQSGHYQRLSAD